MAATNTPLFRFSTPSFAATKPIHGSKVIVSASPTIENRLSITSLPRSVSRTCRALKSDSVVTAAAAVAGVATEEIKECALPSWAMFELGREPIYWKTMNGLPPTSGERMKLFYNPAATNLPPNEEFGIAFNGGFNQALMCGTPRGMLEKTRGKADSPIYSIQICIPKHAVSLIFSFTNGVNWDGPYKLPFRLPSAWKTKPVEFFNEGLALELSDEASCEKAIFPDTNIVVDRCTMMANLTVEGGNRCELNLVPGCMDPSSYLYNPLANVDDGSCLLDIDVEG